MKQLKLSHSKPIIWPLIQWMFPKARFDRDLMTWGDTVYTLKANITEDQYVHEYAHAEQQRFSRIYGLYVILRYYFSMKFRLQCEVEAYRAQWEALGKTPLATYQTATWLCNPLYGNSLTYKEAVKLITNQNV